jgi:hypothetical protein
MSTSNDAGALLAVELWIMTIIVSIISGILAWKWIAPDSIGRAILFIFACGILSKTGHIIGVSLINLLGERK